MPPVDGPAAPVAAATDSARLGAALPNPLRASRWSAAALVTGDAVALALGLLVARPIGGASLAYFAFALLALSCCRLYRLHISLSALDEAPRTVAAAAIPLLVVAPFAGDDGGRVLRQALATAVLLVVVRSVTYVLLRLARRRGLTERTVIAGTGFVGVELGRVLRAHPEYGLDLVGYLGAPNAQLPGPILGDVGELDEIVARERIRRVLVAFGPTREAQLVGVLRTATHRDVEVHVVPRFFEIGVGPTGVDVDDLWGIPVYRVRQAALRAGAWRFKRAMDVMTASALLLVASPMMALAAVLVRCSSPGPILFRQRRIGQHGKEFEVLKFRTLPADYSSGKAWNAWDTEYRNPIGRWLRRLSIDELPQLWNVLRGDMSLVGPRPEIGHFVEQFTETVDGYGDRHRLPAGLTGWAQVHGLRGATSLRERARFDNQYIEHWSLWRDVTILVRTVTAAMRPPHPAAPPETVVRTAGTDALETTGTAARATDGTGGTAAGLELRSADHLAATNGNGNGKGNGNGRSSGEAHREGAAPAGRPDATDAGSPR